MSEHEKPRSRSAAVVGLTEGLVGGIIAPLVVGVLLFLGAPWLQDLLTEPTCDAPRDLRLVRADGATASTVLPPDQVGGTSVSHEASLAIDGDTSTAWVEGEQGADNPYGVGSWIELSLPAGSDVQMVCVVNGYAKSDETFLQNARVRQWKVLTDVGEQVSVLPDKTVEELGAYQALDLKDGPTSKIRLTVETFRAPTGAIRYTDTALSEVELWVR